MFQADAHNDTWHHLQRTDKHDAYDEFCALLKSHIDAFRETEDDLRLAFYIGLRLQRRFYEHALTYFADWKTEPTERRHYRQSVFVYAWKNTVPDKDTERKAYMLELFCETMGITEPDTLREEYEATL